MMIEWRNDNINELSTAELKEVRDLAVASDIDEPENSPSFESLSYQLLDFKERGNVVMIRGYIDGELAAVSSVVPCSTSVMFKVHPDRVKKLEAVLGDSIDTAFVPAYLYLHPKFRGKGYGKQLAASNIAAAKENGFKFMCGYGSHNTVTRSFFAHNYDMKETDVGGSSSLDDEKMHTLRYTAI